MTEEDDAYALAQSLIAQAGAEGWKVLNLSGNMDMWLSFAGERRRGDERLLALTRLPPEIAGLSALQRARPLRLTDLSPLSGLSLCKVTDLSPLSGLPALQELWLSGTQITDLSPLSGLPALQWLDLDGTPVTDLSPLSGLSALQVLWLTGTQVTDLSPLAGLENLSHLYFEDIPACAAEPELDALSRIDDAEERTEKTLAWLRERSPPEPAEARAEGPRFAVSGDRPVTLRQPDMAGAGEQARLHDDCRIKAEVLAQVAPGAGNAQPMLAGAVARYRELIRREAAEIGAREVWSAANALAVLWEAHQAADREGRLAEALAPQIAAALGDLVQTSAIWFLGHPGARAIESWLRGEAVPVPSDADMKLVGMVVEAAKAAPEVIDPDALAPVEDDLAAAGPAEGGGGKARRSAFLWAHNLIADVAGWLWRQTQVQAGNVAGGALTAELMSWVVANKSLLGPFARKLMVTGADWFGALVTRLSGLL